MRDENQWLNIEIKLCRTAVSASQEQLAQSTGLSVQSIKRLERRGANPRYKTIEAIKQVFKALGVSIIRDKEDIRIILSEQILDAIENGTLSEVTAENVSRLKAKKEQQQAGKEKKGDRFVSD